MHINYLKEDKYEWGLVKVKGLLVVIQLRMGKEWRIPACSFMHIKGHTFPVPYQDQVSGGLGKSKRSALYGIKVYSRYPTANPLVGVEKTGLGR